MSLLRDIQNALANEDCDVTVVLRKCKILASRLGSEELGRWVDLELDGYPSPQQIPQYRRLAVQHFASFMNIAYTIPQAAVPLQLVPEKHREAFQYIDFREGIIKAASFAESKKSAIVHKPDLVFALQGKMYPDMNCQAVWGIIPSNDFEQLLGTVKSRMLDFSLKIEADNPDAGDAPVGSQPVALDRVHTFVQNIFYAGISNLAQNSHDFRQSS